MKFSCAQTIALACVASAALTSALPAKHDDAVDSSISSADTTRSKPASHIGHPHSHSRKGHGARGKAAGVGNASATEGATSPARKRKHRGTAKVGAASDSPADKVEPALSVRDFEELASRFPHILGGNGLKKIGKAVRVANSVAGSVVPQISSRSVEEILERSPQSGKKHHMHMRVGGKAVNHAVSAAEGEAPASELTSRDFEEIFERSPGHGGRRRMHPAGKAAHLAEPAADSNAELTTRDVEELIARFPRIFSGLTKAAAHSAVESAAPPVTSRSVEEIIERSPYSGRRKHHMGGKAAKPATVTAQDEAPAPAPELTSRDLEEIFERSPSHGKKRHMHAGGKAANLAVPTVEGEAPVPAPELASRGFEYDLD